MIDLTYVVSVSLTAVVTLPELWKRRKSRCDTLSITVMALVTLPELWKRAKMS